MHRIELPAWALERGRRMNCFGRIEPARTALLAIDLQNAFTLPGQVFGNPHACDVISAVNDLARALRAAGGLVVWTRQTVSRTPPSAAPPWHHDETDPFVARAVAALTRGAEGHALHAGLDRRPGDLVIDKYRYSAFIRQGSDLEDRLPRLGIDTLIIAGTLTNVCCESTARDAYMLGFRVLFASDATAAVTDEEHNAALLNLCLNFADVRSTTSLLALIGKPIATTREAEPCPSPSIPA